MCAHTQQSADQCASVNQCSRRQHKKRRQKFLLLLNSAFIFFIRMNVACSVYRGHYKYHTQYVAIIFRIHRRTTHTVQYLSVGLWMAMVIE